jgi:hypothetical protein
MTLGAVSMVSALGTHLPIDRHWREERRRHAGSRPAGPGLNATMTDWVYRLA